LLLYTLPNFLLHYNLDFFTMKNFTVSKFNLKEKSSQNTHDSRHTKKGKAVKCFFSLLICTILIAVFAYYSYNNAISKPNSESQTNVVFSIQSGEGIRTIADKLVEKELLPENRKQFFLLYLKLGDLIPKIQAGSFNIPKNLTIIELAEMLQDGRSSEIWVQIPEGIRKDEIADVIAEEFENNNVEFSKEEFLALTVDTEYIDSLDLEVTSADRAKINDLEGFLFPDKYLVSKEATPKDIIEKMIANFNSKVKKSITYDQLIIASMLEREGYNSEDRKIIADILNRRIEEGWLVQVDAAFLYYYKDWKHQISVDEKKEDHPYNTYLHLGLTPTPISNPGAVSLDAAMNPTKNKYYFYIHEADYTPHFAVTLDEHINNINKYLK